MKRLLAVSACLALACLSGCGGAPKEKPDTALTTNFSKIPHTERVFAAYSKSGKHESTVPVAAHTKSLWIRLSCDGAAGKLELSMVDQGGGTLDCKGKGPQHSIIAMGYSKDVSTKLKITVVPQPGMTWSAAIDTDRPS